MQYRLYILVLETFPAFVFLDRSAHSSAVACQLFLFLQAQISMQAAVLSPDTIVQLMQANLQSGQGWQDLSSPACLLPDDHWQKVAVSLSS